MVSSSEQCPHSPPGPKERPGRAPSGAPLFAGVAGVAFAALGDGYARGGGRRGWRRQVGRGVRAPPGNLFAGR
jgi:hypothetical protein